MLRREGGHVLMREGVNEVIDQSAMVSSVCWYGHVLRREGGHILC